MTTEADRREEADPEALRQGRRWGRRVMAGIGAALGTARTLVLVIAITVSLLLNGLLVFSDTISSAVAAVATAAGLSSVAARQGKALAAERTARTAAEKTIQRQANDLARTSAALTTEKAARATAEKTIRRQKNEITRAAVNLAAVERTAARQANDLARTSAALTTEKAARATAEKTIRRQKNEITRAAVNLAAVERTAARQANDLARTSAALAGERNTRAKAREQAGTITRRVKSRWRKAVPREIAAMPAEALPVVGTTVIVAATAWELYDICATVRDMAALEQVLDPEAAARGLAGPTICGADVPDRKELANELRERVAKMKEAPGAAWEAAHKSLSDPDVPAMPSWGDVEERMVQMDNSLRDFFKDNWENARKWWDDEAGSSK